MAMDPQFARAHAGLSFTSFLDAFLHLGSDPGELRARRDDMPNVDWNSIRLTLLRISQWGDPTG